MLNIGCVKHLYGNWMKKYPGDELKEALWAAAKSTTMPEFTRAMNNLKKLNEAAWKDMNDLPPSMWTRAAFSTHTCCDLQVNMCEAFNSAILEYRDKPIISLVEGLKFYMTNRIVKLRDYMLRYEGDICPMIQKRLEKFKKDADSWSPNWCGDSEYSMFSASNGTDTYVVNLKERNCSCRKWDLSGIPCCHGIACIWFNNQNPNDYVSHWKTTFLDTYNNIIRPSNGPKGWPNVDATPISPPYVRRAPGRPKKLRRKANDEPRGSKKRNQNTVTCTRCKTLGHNKRSCKGKTTADRMIPKGGNKSNCNMNQPGPSATCKESATTSKGTATTGTKGPAATRKRTATIGTKRKNDNTTPNVITPSATTRPSGPRKSAKIATNATGTQQSVNKP
ncbi:uncharacterized protein LOC123891368 isoform X2 [Trifolium pratense]|uniref:uncharacterized protein LOC123891363 isoform X2 n=1 Tax=Trifolium pratense TaxID=57577 RepID=UPI001E695D5E|nr:uncharacterized protein LOC123891363 isoform X2 [Trifolium pratense]XP_045797183.1 uncharacterized protein LOC123891368 isoform X2 [Trifolium pratense]